MAYGLASAYSVRAVRVGKYARYNVFVCGPKFITSSVCEDTPTSPEVIGTNTLNFRPNFKFSRTKVFGDPIPIWVCVNKAWSISSVYENLRGSTPKGRNAVFPEKKHLGGFMLANKTFSLWTKVHRTFFVERGRNRCRSHFFQILTPKTVSLYRCITV